MGRNNQTKKKHVPTKTKLKKDPGVPRLPDLKQRKNVEKRRATQRTAQPFGSEQDQDSLMASEPTLSSLAALAEASEESERLYNQSEASASSSTEAYKMQLRRQYIRTLHKVIDESDIVILVLDARDPEGCRSRLVEEEVRRREHEGKRLVFVLNKIDLVPRANAEAWLRYLRHTTPTLPFRASTQEQRNNLVSKTSPALLNLLKSIKQSSKRSGMGSITVGVVGYPNVGKSSLINSLRRAKVCAVAAEAGHTKEMQSVQVERGIRVLDSPGVVFDDDDRSQTSTILLRNAIKVEDIADPLAVIDQILLKTGTQKLQSIYNLPELNTALEFLTMLALSAGRLHKGGTPDVLAAARHVIQDWNAQKIPYFTEPPAIHPSNIPSTISSSSAMKYGLDISPSNQGQGTAIVPGAEDVGQAKIITELAPAFDIGGLFNQADSGAFDCEMQDGDDGMNQDQDQDQVVEMESDDLLPRIPRKRSRAPSPSPAPQPNGETGLGLVSSLSSEIPPSKRLKKLERQAMEEAGNKNNNNINNNNYYDDIMNNNKSISATSNPLNRRVLKKEGKKARKAARRAHRIGGAGAGGMDVDDESGLAFTFMAGAEGVSF